MAMRNVSILIAAGMLGTAPAMAQIWAPPSVAPAGPMMSGPSMGSELGRVSHAIHDGRRSGQLWHAQARDLRRERDQINALESRYSAGGMSRRRGGRNSIPASGSCKAWRIRSACAAGNSAGRRPHAQPARRKTSPAKRAHAGHAEQYDPELLRGDHQHGREDRRTLDAAGASPGPTASGRRGTGPGGRRRRAARSASRAGSAAPRGPARACPPSPRTSAACAPPAAASRQSAAPISGGEHRDIEQRHHQPVERAGCPAGRRRGPRRRSPS